LLRRQRGLLLLVLLLLGVFGTVAWCAYHPDTPWLVAAEEWSVVGEYVRRFRARFGGTVTEEETVTAQAPGGAPVPEEPTVPSEIRREVERAPEPVPKRPAPKVETAPAAPYQLSPERPDLAAVAIEWTWVLPGNPIRAEPSERAAVLAEAGGLAYLPVVGSQKSWLQVGLDGEAGWIDSNWKPPYSRRGAKRKGGGREGGSSELTGKAREALGVDRPLKLAGYAVYTDVADSDLVAFLGDTMAIVEDAYFARFGRLPAKARHPAVALFAREADYRRYVATLTRPAEDDVHTEAGVAATFVGQRSRAVLTGSLVHAMTHLLNERALGSDLPPWLDEGLARDLATLRLGEEGTLASMDLDGQSVGPLLSLDRARFEAGRHGPASFALVRYLLDGESRRYADGFRDYLKAVADGRKADLLKALGVSAAELDESLRAWAPAS